MTGKERMKKAIHFQCPDRIPISIEDALLLFMVPPQAWQPAAPYYPYVHQLIIRAGLWKPERRLPDDWLDLTRTAIDEWGTLWKVSRIAPQGEVEKGALEQSWDLLDHCQPPDFSDWERFAFFAEISRELGGDKYVLASDENSLWERYNFLRGFENAMTDLIQHPAEVHRLLEILTGCRLEIAGNFRKCGADGFMLVDDWGTQRRAMISPGMFNEFFRPYYQRIVDRCHQLGMDCGIHSCGNIRLIVPALIDIGFDFLQLDAPNACGIDWLRENAAGRIALFCSPDTMEVYCKNDSALLQAHIKEQISKLAGRSGGYVAWPYLEPDVIGVKNETFELAIELYRKYGKPR